MSTMARRMVLRSLIGGGAVVVVCNATIADQSDDNAMIALARRAVSREVLGAADDRLPDSGCAPGGVFVTIEREGRVIGCRGTLTPRFRTREAEIVAAARAAAGHDPRYRPLTADDLKDFLVTVTLIDRLAPIDAGQVAGLTPADGLVLTAGTRTGIVLPWEGKDPATRLHWAYQKAGVVDNTACTLQRMIARRFRG